MDTSTSVLYTAALQSNKYDLQRFWAIEASGTSPSCSAKDSTSTQTSQEMMMDHTLQDSRGRKTILHYQPINLYVKVEHASW